jgi:hypothetical protein
MMIMDIIQLIHSKGSDDYYFSPSKKIETPENIQLLEKEFETKLPLDYKTVLLEYGPCSIEGEDSLIYMVSIDEILHQLDKLFREKLASALVIGSDGGGSYYFYDIDNSLGKGTHSIFLADRGEASPESVIFIADSFTNLVISFQQGL